MKCRNCHTEVNENEQQCTNCGAPLHNDNDEPTIGNIHSYWYYLPCRLRIFLLFQPHARP